MTDQDVHDLTAPIESDVTVAPGPGGRPGLHVPAVIALKPGESYFYNRPLPGTVRLCDLKDEIAKTRTAIKGAAGSAIKRASDMTGLRYSQSTGEMLTSDGAVVVFSKVTCSEATSND